jgi:hypothetical protein
MELSIRMLSSHTSVTCKFAQWAAYPSFDRRVIMGETSIGTHWVVRRTSVLKPQEFTDNTALPSSGGFQKFMSKVAGSSFKLCAFIVFAEAFQHFVM